MGTIGMVLGTFAFVQMFAGFLVGKFLKQMGGRSQIIVVGITLIVFQTVMLGYLEKIKETELFELISFVAQVLGGIGGGANSAATMALVSSMDPADRE